MQAGLFSIECTKSLASRMHACSYMPRHDNRGMILHSCTSHRGSMGASHFPYNLDVPSKARVASNAVKRGGVRPNLTKFPADARLISSSLPCLPERLRLPWIRLSSLNFCCSLLSLRWCEYCLEIRRALSRSCCVSGGVPTAGDSDVWVARFWQSIRWMAPTVLMDTTASHNPEDRITRSVLARSSNSIRHACCDTPASSDLLRLCDPYAYLRFTEDVYKVQGRYMYPSWDCRRACMPTTLYH